jgi:hypothetical protein
MGVVSIVLGGPLVAVQDLDPACRISSQEKQPAAPCALKQLAYNLLEETRSIPQSSLVGF